MRHGFAPSARRTAISWRRALARASTRLAVLPQTASSSRSVMRLEDDERGGEQTLRSAWRLPERQHLRLHAGVGFGKRDRQLPHDAASIVRLRACLAGAGREPAEIE